tara:strand:- start:955 stop:1239 length:285 start_codon:yes stop_codon:yes gene_type:complete
VAVIADGMHRISTAIPPSVVCAGFTFNQLLVDDEPLLFHTGPRKLFPLIGAAIATVMSVDRLRHIAFAHFEADECGARSVRLCSHALPMSLATR